MAKILIYIIEFSINEASFGIQGIGSHCTTTGKGYCASVCCPCYFPLLTKLVALSPCIPLEKIVLAILLGCIQMLYLQGQEVRQWLPHVTQ